MSVRVSAAVWERSAARGTDLLVLLALADRADDGGDCFPSVAWLARRCRVSVSTVRRSLRALEEAGEVVTVRLLGRSSRYRLAVPDPGQSDRHPGQPDRPDPGQVDRPTPVNLTDTPVTGDRGPRSPVTAYPSTIHQGTNTNVGGDAVAADFDAVWEVYPRKVDRKAALKAYTARRRTGVPAEDLLAAARNYAADVRAKGTDVRFVKHGATFFGPDEPWAEWVHAPDPAPVSYDTPAVQYR